MSKLFKWLGLLLLSLGLLYLGATFYYVKNGDVSSVLGFVYDRPNPNWQQTLREKMLFCCKKFSKTEMADSPPLSSVIALNVPPAKTIELIDFLVAQGADVNQVHKPTQMTALHMALLEDNDAIEIIATHLLKLGANPNLKNIKGNNAIESAKHLMQTGVIKQNNHLIQALETYGARYATVPTQP